MTKQMDLFFDEMPESLQTFEERLNDCFKNSKERHVAKVHDPYIREGVKLLHPFEKRLNECFRNIKERYAAKSNNMSMIVEHALTGQLCVYDIQCEKNIAEIVKERTIERLFDAVKISDRKIDKEKVQLNTCKNTIKLQPSGKCIFSVPDFNFNIKHIIGERKMLNAEGKSTFTSIFFVLYTSRPYSLSNYSEMNYSIFPSKKFNNMNFPINILIT